MNLGDIPLNGMNEWVGNKLYTHEGFYWAVAGDIIWMGDEVTDVKFMAKDTPANRRELLPR